jgi:hypothetical protein
LAKIIAAQNIQVRAIPIRPGQVHAGAPIQPLPRSKRGGSLVGHLTVVNFFRTANAKQTKKTPAVGERQGAVFLEVGEGGGTLDQQNKTAVTSGNGFILRKLWNEPAEYFGSDRPARQATGNRKTEFAFSEGREAMLEIKNSTPPPCNVQETKRSQLSRKM